MRNIGNENVAIWEKLATLTANITQKSFESDVYDVLSEIADISHFAVFMFDAASVSDYRLALTGGQVTGHWARQATRRSGLYLQKTDGNFDLNLDQIAKGLLAPDGIFRFQPDDEYHPEIAQIYRESNIQEKAYCVHVSQGRIHQLNLYRSNDSGPFSEGEIAMLQRVLPLVMNLTLIHFRMSGTDDWQKKNEKNVISFLKAKGYECFTPLTAQETIVCDMIVYGQTTDGIAAEMEISASTVKTYRNRAYKKLQISSKSELFAMVINNQIHSA